MKTKQQAALLDIPEDQACRAIAGGLRASIRTLVIQNQHNTYKDLLRESLKMENIVGPESATNVIVNRLDAMSAQVSELVTSTRAQPRRVSFNQRSPSSFNQRSPSSFNQRSPSSFNQRSPSSFYQRSPSSFNQRSPSPADRYHTTAASRTSLYLIC